MTKSRAFIIAGMLFIISAIGISGHNIIEDNKSEKASSASYLAVTAMTKDEPEETVNPKREMPVVTVDGVDYIGTLEIEAIDMKMPVTAECDDYRLNLGTSRYVGSAYENNMIIAGHSSTALFGNIKQLIKGDLVKFTDVENNEFLYRVLYMETISENAVNQMLDGEWDLTLFTCTFDLKNRYTVRCVKERNM